MSAQEALARVRVLIVDDEPVYAEALLTALASSSDIEVVATALTTERAIELAESLVPDVIVCDVRMPGGGALRVAEAVRSQPSHLIAVSAAAPLHVADELAALGATGPMPKSMPLRDLIDLVRARGR